MPPQSINGKEEERDDEVDDRGEGEIRGVASVAQVVSVHSVL